MRNYTSNSKKLIIDVSWAPNVDLCDDILDLMDHESFLLGLIRIPEYNDLHGIVFNWLNMSSTNAYIDQLKIQESTESMLDAFHGMCGEIINMTELNQLTDAHFISPVSIVLSKPEEYNSFSYDLLTSITQIRVNGMYPSLSFPVGKDI